MHIQSVLKSPIVRLLVYFGILAVALWGLATVVPWFATLLIPTSPGAEGIPRRFYSSSGSAVR